MLHLTESDVARLPLDPAELRVAIEEIFRRHHAGLIETKPKLSLDIGPGHKFQTLVAAGAEEGFAVNKWVGVRPAEAGSQGQTVHATIILNDYRSAEPVCIMDGNGVTGLRTAAMSAAAAAHLAPREPETLGFVGCGLQARFHLDALLSLRPSLQRIVAFARSARSREAFARWAEETHGRAVHFPGDAESVVRQSDLLVTSVPAAPDLKPYLDAAWIRPGGFVAAVDLARSWRREGLDAVEFLATDDHAQEAESPTVPGLRACDADLGEIVSGKRRPGTGRDRRMFMFRGHAVADLVAAAMVYRKARETPGG